MSEKKPIEIDASTGADLDWEIRRYKANILGQISAGAFIAGILAPIVGYLINFEITQPENNAHSSVISQNTEINMAIVASICIVLSVALYYAGEHVLKGGDK